MARRIRARAKGRAGEDVGQHLVSAAEAARQIDVTDDELDRLRRSGRLHAVRQGWGRYLYREDELRAYRLEVAAAAVPSWDEKDAVAKILAEIGPDIVSDDDDDVTIETAPIVRLANAILVRGIEEGASDTLVESDLRNVIIRFRVGGALRDGAVLPKKAQQPLIDRYKKMAGLDSGGRDAPQVGSIFIRTVGGDYAIRVTALRTAYGEDILLHPLDEAKPHVGLEKLGQWSNRLDILRDAARTMTDGLILLTGPAGSGVTTTAATLLTELNTPERRIATLERTAEYRIRGVRHSYDEGGQRFSAMAAVLTASGGDVLFFGDINRPEMAAAAVDAALAGRRVIATLAAPGAEAALCRLESFGTPAETLRRIMRVVTSQRLLRRVCAQCQEACTIPADELPALDPLLTEAFAAKELTAYRGKGCAACRGTGYRGCIAAFEVMAGSRDEDAYHTMRSAAIAMVLRGETTVEEVFRVFGPWPADAGKRDGSGIR